MENGEGMRAYSLVARRAAERGKERLPSRRYLVWLFRVLLWPPSVSLFLSSKQSHGGGRADPWSNKDLLVQGAREHSLPDSYIAQIASQPVFCPSSSRAFRFGKWSFELVWLRVSRLVQKGVVNLKNENGCVPWWFLKVFDALLVVMWWHHDFLHRFVWGAGDGRL